MWKEIKMIKRHQICEACEENDSSKSINAVDLTNRKIYLFDLMNEITGVMISQAFTHWRDEDNESQTKCAMPVEFVINCPGGFMEIVIGIIAEINHPDNKFEIRANVISIAYSAAAILLLYIAKDKIRMFTGGHVMFHYSSWSAMEQNVMEHKRDSLLQEKIFNGLVQKGLNRTKIKLEELTPMIDVGDAYFDANKCINVGLVGEIYG